MAFSLAIRLRNIALMALLSGSLSMAASAADPFNTAALHSSGPAPCQVVPAGAALDLAQVVEQALCNNPQTRQVWANARVQAAQVGLARSAYLPSLDASVGSGRSKSSGGKSYDTSGDLVLGYLLYDFGERAAALESSLQMMAALAATEDATSQNVFLAAVEAYYQALAAEAAVVAANESERASQESFKAATARYRIGSGTPADRLQAQTAAAQAGLVRIQAEGNVHLTLGALANVMGLDAHQTPKLLSPSEVALPKDFENNISRLIEQAKKQRPDLVAAEAQVKASQANIDVARASGLPKIRLSARQAYAGSDFESSNRIGVSINIPLFNGFNTTYRVRAAEAQRDVRLAQRDQVEKQVSLDVWRSYYALQTSTESVRASSVLITSAEQSEKVASGRYKAGVGSILELLNAHSALASARQQHIQAQYNWRIAKASLAQAMGRLDFDQINRQAKP